MLRRELIEFGRVVIDMTQFHGRLSWLEDDFPGLGRSVVNVLEFQPGVGWNEQVLKSPGSGVGASTLPMPSRAGHQTSPPLSVFQTGSSCESPTDSNQRVIIIF